MQSFRSSSSFLHLDSWPKIRKKCSKIKLCYITVRQMGAVEKVAHRYWVIVLGVLRGPKASSMQSFRSSTSLLTVQQMGAVEKIAHRY